MNCPITKSLLTSGADIEMAGNDETMPPMLVDWELAGDDTDKEGKPKTGFEQVQKVETKEGMEKLPAETAWCCW